MALELRSKSQVQLPVAALQRPWASHSHEPSASDVTTVGAIEMWLI